MITPEMFQINSISPQVPVSDVFQVGMVGHRHNRLTNADLTKLKDILNSILKEIKNEVLSFYMPHVHLYKSSTPVLRAISPLAEGTDRLFADQALDLEFELLCVMPFAQTEFEKDFSSDNALEHDSLNRFHDLLSRAEKVSKIICIELDGKRENEGAAYGATGDFILNKSDILVAVWDGEYKGLAGGTEETLKKAQDKRVPVIWIDANAPHPWQVLVPRLSSADPEKDSLLNKSSTQTKLKSLIKNILVNGDC